MSAKNESPARFVVDKSWARQPGEIWEVIKETPKTFLGRRNDFDFRKRDRTVERRIRKQDVMVVCNSMEDAQAFKNAYFKLHKGHKGPIEELKIALSTALERSDLALQALTEEYDLRSVEQRLKDGLTRRMPHYTAGKT